MTSWRLRVRFLRAGKRVIVTFDNHRDRAACPVKRFLQMARRIGCLVEIVEVDIKYGVHRILGHAERFVSAARSFRVRWSVLLAITFQQLGCFLSIVINCLVFMAHEFACI